MRLEFEDINLKELIEKGENKHYRSISRSKELMSGLRNAYKVMLAAQNVSSLARYSFLHYEKLRYQYSGYSSVRLSNRSPVRLIFTEHDGGIKIILVKLDETHYGSKK